MPAGRILRLSALIVAVLALALRDSPAAAQTSGQIPPGGSPAAAQTAGQAPPGGSPAAPSGQTPGQISPGGPAATGAAPAPSLSDSLRGEARAAYETAKVLEANSDFAGALQKLEQAYENQPDPRLLYEMAICQKSLHHYASMKALLIRYLQRAGSTISADHRAAVVEALSALDSLVATLTVTVNPPDATIQVDGETVGTSPLAAPLTVDLGTHTVAASKAGFVPAGQSVVVEGGGAAHVSLSLVAHEAIGHLVVLADDAATVFVDGDEQGKGVFQGAVSAGTHVVRVTQPGKVTALVQIELSEGETRTMPIKLASRPGGAQRAWGVVLGIVGLVATGGSVALGYVNKAGYDADNADGCVGDVCTRMALSNRQGHIEAGNVFTYVFLGGAAFVGGGVALYVTAPTAKDPVRPVLAFGPHGIGVGGVW